MVGAGMHLAFGLFQLDLNNPLQYPLNTPHLVNCYRPGDSGVYFPNQMTILLVVHGLSFKKRQK